MRKINGHTPASFYSAMKKAWANMCPCGSTEIVERRREQLQPTLYRRHGCRREPKIRDVRGCRCRCGRGGGLIVCAARHGGCKQTRGLRGLQLLLATLLFRADAGLRRWSVDRQWRHRQSIQPLGGAGRRELISGSQRFERKKTECRRRSHCPRCFVFSQTGGAGWV